MNNSTFLVLSVRVTEFLVDLIKSLFTIAGVVAAALADVVMGTIGVSLLFGGLGGEFFGYKTTVLGGAISLAAGAFQIYMWAILKKRKISFLEAIRFWELPKDIRAFVGCTLAILVVDTSIDVSPISLLVVNSAYKQLPILHEVMVFLVCIMLVVICGFSEILTSNLREILLGGQPEKHQIPQPKSQSSVMNGRQVLDALKQDENPRYIPRQKPQFGSFQNMKEKDERR